jgi:putative endonuclease
VAGRPEVGDVASRNEIGRAGEDRAAAWYEHNGYEVVARNWRVRAGEIDLIAARPGLVVFCEVKTRSSRRYGAGAEAVDWRKQQRIRTVALHWLAQLGHRVPDIRFDVAQVDAAGTVEVIEGCF